MPNIHSYVVMPGEGDDPEEVLKNDADFQNGKAVYTSLRTYGSVLFQLPKHYARLKLSSRQLGFEILQPLACLRAVVLEIMSLCDSLEQFIKITATPNNVVIITRPLVIDESIYEGVSSSTTELERSLFSAKYKPSLEMTEAYKKAVETGHHDVLLINKAGNITEGSRSNVLWIKGSTLYFCPHALAGITQTSVLDCAINHFPDQTFSRIEKVSEGLSLADLWEIDELFLTQTSRGVIPVLRVGDVQIGNGQVGEKTKALKEKFDQLTRSLS